jgi:small subunit ribosomal protein S17
MAETMNGTSNSGSTGGGNGLVGGAQGVQGARAGQGGAARNARNARKVRTGLVVSDKMQKTVVVAIERRVPHPVYGKMVTRTKRVKAHDEENTAKTGDTVRIMETRPLSKDKRWRVVEVVERAR